MGFAKVFENFVPLRVRFGRRHYPGIMFCRLHEGYIYRIEAQRGERFVSLPGQSERECYTPVVVLRRIEFVGAPEICYCNVRARGEPLRGAVRAGRPGLKAFKESPHISVFARSFTDYLLLFT